jgi:hypothetical protein
MAQRWISEPMPLPRDPRAPYKRVDLEFEEVEHDSSSFVALVYLNNEKATARTGRDETKGFAAAFSVFGHGVCWGEQGHCERTDRASAFDRRPEHALTPQNVTLDVTDSVKQLGDVDELRVTVVATSTDPQKSRGILRFRALTLVTYE